MNIAIYNPYMHILGGAERYVLSIARCLSDQNSITIFADDPDILQKGAEKFGLQVNNTTIRPWLKNRSERNQILKNFDLLFYITDGSLFFSSCKNSILIIQSPLHIPKLNLLNRLKIKSFQKIICYSDFMADIIKQKLKLKAETLFVPINSVQNKHLTGNKKENIILSVGRFFPHLHSKKQKEMVEMFKKMINQGLKNTKLYLVGSIDPGGEDCYKEVVRLSQGYPIKVITNANFMDLRLFYHAAKIYWHATGFGEDLEKYPEKAEHFGVTTLEAMSYGCTPIVFNAGGQKELVDHKINGFVWNSEEELIKYTKELLENPKLFNILSKKAIEKSQKFILEKFCKRLKQLL